MRKRVRHENHEPPAGNQPRMLGHDF
jgi:hypothetical protein